MDFNDSTDTVAATDSNSDYNAASDVDTISSSEKFGVTISVLSITAPPAVSTLHKFPARKPFKYSIQNSRRILLKEIPIHAWPTHFSNAYNLFHLSSFYVNDYIFPKSNFIWLCDHVYNRDSYVLLTDYFQYCLFNCTHKFCRTHLTCCSYGGVKSHCVCLDNCSDCASSNHSFFFCPKLLQWLHEPNTSHHLHWENIVRDWIISCPPPHFKA